jgi:hypothetical protein
VGVESIIEREDTGDVGVDEARKLRSDMEALLAKSMIIPRTLPAAVIVPKTLRLGFCVLPTNSIIRVSMYKPIITPMMGITKSSRSEKRGCP